MMLLVAISASAQQGTTELRGRVIDAQGAVLPGVTVVVRNQETGMVRDTVSGQTVRSSRVGSCRAPIS